MNPRRDLGIKGGVRENPNIRSLKLRFFSPGKRNVIDTFIAKDLKNRPEARTRLLRHLQILKISAVRTLREQQRLERVRGEILSYRFKVPQGRKSVD